jgi:two-component system, NtrC family, response regulator AtoC
MQISNDRTVLVGEDEPEVRSYLETALRCNGFSVALAENGEEVLDVLRDMERSVSAVLLDIIMPEKDGLETLREIRSMYEDLPVLMISGECSPPRVMEAMRCGATDFLGKPVSHEDLTRALRKVLSDGVKLPARLAPNLKKTSPDVFMGGCRAQELQLLLSRIAPADIPVLIHGETGTGKEVFARQIHANSPRASSPFIKLNCAALPSELVESELFGYERGAFTGAFQKKPGMFEMADGGTLMLDEIGDMDIRLQAKLLQVLQDQEFRRIGGKESIRVNVRVIAATHRNLEQAITAGQFREDLYYRLNVVSVNIPALRHSKEILLPLAEFLLKKHARGGTPVPTITPALGECLMAHEWPGNVRELENIMRRLIVFGDAEMVLQDLRLKTRMRNLAGSLSTASVAKPAAATASTAPVLQEVDRVRKVAESQVILDALQTTKWNRKEAAALLKIDYKALLYKMKKLNIDTKV